MRRPLFHILSALFLFFIALSWAHAYQSSSGTLAGTITDPSGAVVPGAKVQITNHVSGYNRTATSDSSGQFRFYNVPFNPYRINVTAEGFGTAGKSVDVNATVPIVLPIQL